MKIKANSNTVLKYCYRPFSCKIGYNGCLAIVAKHSEYDSVLHFGGKFILEGVIWRDRKSKFHRAKFPDKCNRLKIDYPFNDILSFFASASEYFVIYNTSELSRRIERPIFHVLRVYNSNYVSFDVNRVASKFLTGEFKVFLVLLLFSVKLTKPFKV